MNQLTNLPWRWIAFVVVLLALSNFLTGTHYNGLRKKDKKQFQHQLDSLDKRYLEESILQLANVERIQRIHEEDSIMLEQSKALYVKDQNLIRQQKEALKKYKKLSSHDLLQKLDSAYEADVDYN